jgi:uncharacterized protein YceH (UPF0502 family)
MSSVLESPAAEAPATWPILTAHERRILGVLVEKAKTTPDAYPLSLNALVTGSNQKSNRDPLLNLSDVDVEEALLTAQKKGLIIKITGGRVERWRHALYEGWRVDKVELAVLAELLLRGPQTEGELRSRAGRMEPIEDLDALRAVLRPLAERRLVVYLTPEGRRGTTLTHGFHAPTELERLRHKHSAEVDAVSLASETPAPAAAAVAQPPTEPDALAALEARLAEAHSEIATLRSTVADLQTNVAGLAEQLRGIKQALGV